MGVEVLWFVFGIISGGAAGWFIAKYKFHSESKSNDTALLVYEQRIKDLISDLDQSKIDFKIERDKVITLSNRVSGHEAEFKFMEKKLQEQKEDVGKIQEKFSLEFKNLANEILEEKTLKFTKQNKENLESLLKPLGQKIVEFEKTVGESTKESISRNSALKEQINSLKDLNLQITKEAENLTRALKGDNRTQGSWGEFILESILEKSGLEKNREYFVQNAFIHEDGKRYQPDVIVNLPDKKNLIIDSKVSLVAYEKVINDADETVRAISLKNHLNSIRTHIKDLSSKNYQKLYGVKGLDFVLMFIPIEPAFSMAIQNDSNLFNEAYEKNIVMVSPSTLIATLRTIANIWKNEYQNRNALEIARQGGELYDKFVNFTEDLKNVGRHINSSQKVYSEAMNKLVDGKGNLISRAKKIKQLGASTHKTLDQKLIDEAESDTE